MKWSSNFNPGSGTTKPRRNAFTRHSEASFRRCPSPAHDTHRLKSCEGTEALQWTYFLQDIFQGPLLHLDTDFTFLCKLDSWKECQSHDDRKRLARYCPVPSSTHARPIGCCVLPPCSAVSGHQRVPGSSNGFLEQIQTATLSVPVCFPGQWRQTSSQEKDKQR
jgi:hypothetical protein